MSKERKKFRMTLPKSEEDYHDIEEEIHGGVEESREEEPVHLGVSEDAEILLLNTIAHTLSHIELEINNLNIAFRDFGEKVESLRGSVKTLTKAVLLTSLKSAETHKKLLKDILEELLRE